MTRSVAAERSGAGAVRAVLFPLAGMVLALAAPAAPAMAQVTEEAAAAQIRTEYGVEVLRVRAGTVDGRPVWLITVMKPGGTSNSAFQVTTLAVDQATGDLVPAYRHGRHGAEGSGDSVDTRLDLRPDNMRTGTWR